jgi:hypothetical protein
MLGKASKKRIFNSLSILSVLLGLFLSGCTYEQDKIDDHHDGSPEKVTTKKAVYLSDLEVEKWMNSHSPQFLFFFWEGMQKSQCIEVLRYMFDKGDCQIFRQDGSKIETIDRNLIKELTLDSNGDCYLNGIEYKLTYSLVSTNKVLPFELELGFNGPADCLNQVSLRLVDWNGKLNLNLDDFNYLLELYTSKYGKPKDKTDHEYFLNDFFTVGKDFRKIKFLKDKLEIELSFDSKHSDSPCNINITYLVKTSNKLITYKESERFYDQMQKENELRQKQQEMERKQKLKEKMIEAI